MVKLCIHYSVLSDYVFDKLTALAGIDTKLQVLSMCTVYSVCTVQVVNRLQEKFKYGPLAIVMERDHRF